jgi:cytochrome c-type biogenesis protein CcmH
VLELKKSLLSDTANAAGSGKSLHGHKQKQGAHEPGGKSDNLTKALPLIMVLLIPLVTYLMYEQWGYLDDVQLMDLYERTIASDNNQQESRDLVIELGRVVQQDESNQWAWYFLGRNFSNLGMFGEADIAFQRASDLMPDGPDKAATLGLQAQIKYLVAGGEMTEEVLSVVGEARAINPSENASLQLLSVDAEMQGDLQAAIGYWRLMIQSNPNSAQAQQLRGRIAAAQQQLAAEGADATQAGPSIDVSVALEPGLELPSGMRVFVSARNAEQEGTPPLAAIDLVVDDLPATVTLDNNLALTPAFNLSSAQRVYVTATVSRTGSATVQPGDYRVASDSFSVSEANDAIALTISLSDIVR